MKFEIKNRFSGKVIFEFECSCFKACVEASIKSGANLSRADMSGANLSRANLSGADLYGANLYEANLSGADLSRANLSGADLYGADLYGANLYGANLYGANLSGANLYGANLYGANLSGADLYGANLSGADLYGADLSRANLYGADLSRAKNAELAIAKTQITPQEGAFVAWKKLSGEIIAKLIIPHDAERLNAVGSRKCRASKAFVYEMYGATEAVDKHTGKLIYKQGEEVIPDEFNPSKFVECSNGIHFFMTREEAEDY